MRGIKEAFAYIVENVRKILAIVLALLFIYLAYHVFWQTIAFSHPNVKAMKLEKDQLQTADSLCILERNATSELLNKNRLQILKAQIAAKQDSANYYTQMVQLQQTIKSYMEKTQKAQKAVLEIKKRGNCWKVNWIGKTTNIDCDKVKFKEIL
jgi:hypothetical protein